MFTKVLTIVLTGAALAANSPLAAASERLGNQILADARIIHIPQPGESANYSEEPGAAGNEDVHEYVVPRSPRSPRPRITRRRLYHSDFPPAPPVSRRTVVSAPPPPAEGPSPIRPLPRFESKAGPVRTLDAQGEASAAPAANGD